MAYESDNTEKSYEMQETDFIIACRIVPDTYYFSTCENIHQNIVEMWLILF